VRIKVLMSWPRSSPVRHHLGEPDRSVAVPRLHRRQHGWSLLRPHQLPVDPQLQAQEVDPVDRQPEQLAVSRTALGAGPPDLSRSTAEPHVRDVPTVLLGRCCGARILGDPSISWVREISGYGLGLA
jgi:hypothetical protein